MMMRFEQTDFKDSAEFMTLAQMGPLPEKFGKRNDDFGFDREMHSIELSAIGITGDEHKKAMKRFMNSMQ